jgi:Mg2+/Co2+ transporter CorB
VVIGELTQGDRNRRTLPTAGTAQPLAWFCRLSFPFIWVWNWSAQWLLRQIGIQPVSGGDAGHSEEELRLLFAASTKQRHGGSLGHEIVLNALDLRHRVARDVMRPRQESVAFNTEASMTECLDVAERTRFSRFPLCEGGDVDKSLGVVNFGSLWHAPKARSGAVCCPLRARSFTCPKPPGRAVAPALPRPKTSSRLWSTNTEARWIAHV